ncbi:hypothetical protein LXL04_000141 [Taraxacum kok-saghyz]
MKESALPSSMVSEISAGDLVVIPLLYSLALAPLTRFTVSAAEKTKPVADLLSFSTQRQPATPVFAAFLLHRRPRPVLHLRQLTGSLIRRPATSDSIVQPLPASISLLICSDFACSTAPTSDFTSNLLSYLRFHFEHSLHKDSWNKVGRVLKENFGVDLTQKQMKNSYDNLKAKYTGWIYLKNKTGNLYNPQTNTFNLTTEEWDEFKKGHPKAASLKTTPLLFPELCATLFDGNSATGNMRWTSSQTTSLAGSSYCPVPPLQLTSTSFHALDDDDDISHHSSGPFPDQASPPHVPSPNPNPNKRAKPSTPRAPTTSPDQASSATPKPTLDDLTVDMQKALQKMVKGPTEHTVPECVEKLNNVLQLPQTDPFRYAAYYIFSNTMNMREMWMNLPDEPAILKGWITMTAKEALADPHAHFPFPPPDKYYLCDAAYSHIRGFMAPYRNVRYWLGDFRQRRALTNKEKFNHAHAKLQNVIERSYGVLKARFPILKRMAPFLLVTQTNIVVACFALHNFIRKEGISDEYFAEYD